MSSHLGDNIHRLVVALDGSASSERVLPVVVQCCERAGIVATLVAGGTGAAIDRERVERLARECGSCVNEVDIVDPDELPVELIRRARDPGSLIMVSGHGPGRAPTSVRRSLVAELLADGAAVIILGPKAQARPLDLPVVALVDGSSESAQAVPVAAGWARAMRVPMELVIITRPELAPPLVPPQRVDGRSPQPDRLLDEAMREAAAAWPGLDVHGRVITYPCVCPMPWICTCSGTRHSSSSPRPTSGKGSTGW